MPTIQEQLVETQRLAELAKQQDQFPTGTEFTPGTAAPLSKQTFNVPTPTGAISAEDLTSLTDLRNQFRAFQQQFTERMVPTVEEQTLSRQLEEVQLRGFNSKLDS